jgi:hypothetical protein
VQESEVGLATTMRFLSQVKQLSGENVALHVRPNIVGLPYVPNQHDTAFAFEEIEGRSADRLSASPVSAQYLRYLFLPNSVQVCHELSLMPCLKLRTTGLQALYACPISTYSS